jgi:hypothetical protein
LDIRRDCGAVIRCVWDGSDLAFSSRRLNFWLDVVLTRSWINKNFRKATIGRGVQKMIMEGSTNVC